MSTRSLVQPLHFYDIICLSSDAVKTEENEKKIVNENKLLHCNARRAMVWALGSAKKKLLFSMRYEVIL